MSAVIRPRVPVTCALLLVLLPLLAYAPHAQAPAEPTQDWSHAAMARPAESLVCARLHGFDGAPVIATAGYGRLARLQQTHGLNDCGGADLARDVAPSEAQTIAVRPSPPPALEPVGH
ncbi:hypothetical protein SAMN05428989_3370 [Pseudoxanthomonas sp. GM95]|uniref:hypothetical protein n=1 Tax=Pseudoxanthomonas sp. GM95 TaxID=1881043 RepID=UPI0008CDA394|nr:hypothetical protein [Pseudoxanthomonas sp. GM95]SEM21003.1 hypothetical protein SAMN05428989_3370 [Pseudoxanthomonas sp. GM95]